jgi:hypothetical protein
MNANLNNADVAAASHTRTLTVSGKSDTLSIHHQLQIIE